MLSNSFSEINFAGFLMTYERDKILEDTIKKIFSQSITPKKLLIIDNGITESTELMILRLNNPMVSYHRVGRNSGPAGAAKIGLEILSREGFDWIYWGDDDDAPIFIDTFKILLEMAISNEKCGCVGVVGQFFNKTTGFIKRVPSDLLKFEGVLEVDTIAGGMSKIINGEMIRKKQIYPNEKLFFGMEELDFDLQIKKVGYKLLVNRNFYYQHRLMWNRIEIPNKKMKIKSKNSLIREYYSIRNGLYILNNNKFFIAQIIFFMYYLIKQILSFKFGFKEGFIRIRIFYLAINDLINLRMGKFIY